jgi:hypothetical protein
VSNLANPLPNTLNPLYPQSMATLWYQPDGTYAAASTGAQGEVAVEVPITDAVCYEDLDPNGNETTSDAQALSQDIFHILLEVYGSNLDDLARGIGVEGWLSANSDKIEALPSIIDSQLRKDTRITSSKSKLIVLGTSPPSYQINIELVASGSVIPLAFLFTQAQGLTPL